MNSRYLTLAKSDPTFNDYLWGKVEHDSIPIAIQSLNIGAHDESITFELKNRNEIKSPHIILLACKLVKLNSFLFVLFPLFYVITKNILSDTLIDPFSLSLASIALCFLFAALNIRNYFSDDDLVKTG